MDLLSRSKAIKTGQKFYFTGKPCKHGHIAERRTISAACEECNKEHYDKTKAAIAEGLANAGQE